MLWLKGAIDTQFCHYLNSTKEEDNPILYIVNSPNFLSIILEFWLLVISNLFPEMPISVEYMIHFYFKFKWLPLYTGIYTHISITYSRIL